MQNTLFVFGSFSEGMIHRKDLAQKIESSLAAQAPATICGALYRLTSGVSVLDAQGSQIISGTVLEFNHADTVLALLDEFHGFHRADPDKSFLLRRDVLATCENGQSFVTTAYCINPKRVPRGAKPIESGNARDADQTLLSRLTERQVAYIRKLGSSSGREIVPIDLSLYRELMHLEIVVDKGRRLALSPLGQEIFRFL